MLPRRISFRMRPRSGLSEIYNVAALSPVAAYSSRDFGKTSENELPTMGVFYGPVISSDS